MSERCTSLSNAPAFARVSSSMSVNKRATSYQAYTRIHLRAGAIAVTVRTRGSSEITGSAVSVVLRVAAKHEAILKHHGSRTVRNYPPTPPPWKTYSLYAMLDIYRSSFFRRCTFVVLTTFTISVVTRMSTLKRQNTQKVSGPAKHRTTLPQNASVNLLYPTVPYCT